MKRRIQIHLLFVVRSEKLDITQYKFTMAEPRFLPETGVLKKGGYIVSLEVGYFVNP
jgi:hypothetical protein